MIWPDSVLVLHPWGLTSLGLHPGPAVSQPCRSVGKSPTCPQSLRSPISGLAHAWLSALNEVTRILSGDRLPGGSCHPGSAVTLLVVLSTLPISSSAAAALNPTGQGTLATAPVFHREDFLRVFSFVSFTVICFIDYRSNLCSLQETMTGQIQLLLGIFQSFLF